MKRTKSIYAVTFSENTSKLWSKSRAENMMFLLMVKNHLNDKLRSRYVATPEGDTVRKGYLFLNEVFDMLGMPYTKAGQVVGWTYDKNNQFGDNFVDFDINVRGTNPNVVLDFNVDGNICDIIWQ